MHNDIRRKALTKLAFYGSTWVTGSPRFGIPQLTVGQAMYNLNSQTCNTTNNNLSTSNIYMPRPRTTLASDPAFYASALGRRNITDQIVNTGIGVNSPAKSLLHAGIGALAGNFIANALKTGPFVRGLMTATGANYGYNN